MLIPLPRPSLSSSRGRPPTPVFPTLSSGLMLRPPPSCHSGSGSWVSGHGTSGTTDIPVDDGAFLAAFSPTVVSRSCSVPASLLGSSCASSGLKQPTQHLIRSTAHTQCPSYREAALTSPRTPHPCSCLGCGQAPTRRCHRRAYGWKSRVEFGCSNVSVWLRCLRSHSRSRSPHLQRPPRAMN